jgi:hypothetical protein
MLKRRKNSGTEQVLGKLAVLVRQGINTHRYTGCDSGCARFLATGWRYLNQFFSQAVGTGEFAGKKNP